MTFSCEKMPDTLANEDFKNTGWEDVYLRGIFSECDSSTSSLPSAGSMAPVVSVSDIVGYIGDNLPNTPEEFLLELRKSLETVSPNGFVNWRQFKEASRSWIARLRELRYQDGNNNVRKADYADFLIDHLAKETDVSDQDYADYVRTNDEIENLPALRGFEDMDGLTDFSNDSSPEFYDKISPSTMTDMTSGSTKKEEANDELTEVELRLRVRRSYEENTILEEELLAAEERIQTLRQQRDSLQRELEQAKRKCQLLQKENDEQKAVLDEITEKERTCSLALQRIEKQRHSLQEKLEAAELEVQSVAALNVKLQKIEKEKQHFAKLTTKTQQELEEKQNECEELRVAINQLQEKSASLQEANEKTIRNLREQNQQLASENTELLAERSIVNGFGPEDKFSTSSVPSLGYCYAHSTPHKPVKLERQESLFDELKASGFSAKCGGTSSRSQELEDELNWYDEEVCRIHQQLESVVNGLATSLDTAYVPRLQLKNEDCTKTRATEMIKQKISLLQEMILETTKQKPVSDSSVQVQAESVTSHLEALFRIPSFQDYLKSIGENSEKRVGGVSMTSRRTDGSTEEDTFLKIIGTSANASATPVEEYAIIGPIVAVLDKIVQDTSNRENSSAERSPDGNLRSRSIYTYTTCRASEGTSSSDNPLDSHQGRRASFGKGDCLGKEVAPKECKPDNEGSASSTDTGEIKDLPARKSPIRPMAKDAKVTENKSFTWRSEMATDRNSSSDSNINASNYFNESLEKELMKSKDIPQGELLGNSQVVQVPMLSLTSSAFDPPQDQSPGAKKVEDFEATRNPLAKTKFSAYREALDPALKSVPRRKASVFHRSFDVSTLENQVVEERLTEIEVKRSASSPSIQEESKNEEDIDKSELFSGRTDLFKYTFSNTYRSRLDSSESSSSSPSPRKSDSSTSNDVSFTEEPQQAASKLIVLHPPRLKLPRLKESPSSNVNSSVQPVNESFSVLLDKSTNQQETKNFLSETKILKVGSFSNLPRRNSLTNQESDWSSNVNFRRDYSTADSNSLISTPRNDSDAEISSQDELPCKLSSETYVLSHRSSLPCNKAQITAGGKVKDPGYSPTVEKENSGGQRRVERPVALVMSSREESSESESDQTEASLDKPFHQSIQPKDQRESIASSTPFASSNASSNASPNASSNAQEQRISSTDSPINGESSPRGKINGRNVAIGKTSRGSRQRILAIRRTLSDGENSDRDTRECRCCRKNAKFPGEKSKSPAEPQQRIFPSLTDAYLQESGIANLSETQSEYNENISEEELERKYSAFSLGLCTDRVTLNRRVALFIRQRDQAERNLSCEVQKMQHDIQELAPLCTDRESLERVERVRHQLEMIAQCANRVSCAAESLGAVHQESRISRAILLADKYLQTLRAKCEKLAGEIAETKRILTENNIVIEEHPTELADDLPRILRYRSGMPANNRTMMAKRRASIATISRPLGNLQDTIKEGVRQRNSVSGRVTLRRPSFSYETQKWENEKLDRTESSSSVGELRGIYEQAESRRNSREENNNVLRGSQTINTTISTNGRTVDGQVWTSCKEEPSLEEPALEDIPRETRLCLRTQDSFRIANNLPWRSIVWFVLIFFFGFYVNHAISSTSGCDSAVHRWWSIQEILSQYLQIRNPGPRPI